VSPWALRRWPGAKRHRLDVAAVRVFQCTAHPEHFFWAVTGSNAGLQVPRGRSVAIRPVGSACLVMRTMMGRTLASGQR